MVEDTGAADRVRADYWPDPLIRDLATRYATEVHIDTNPPDDRADDSEPSPEHVERPPRPRKPRTPRKPRDTREAEQASHPHETTVEEGAA